jgi:hypothetical protein
MRAVGPLLLLIGSASAWAYPPTLFMDVPDPASAVCLYENTTAGQVEQLPVVVDNTNGKAEFGYRVCYRVVTDWPPGNNVVRAAVRAADGRTSVYVTATIPKPWLENVRLSGSSTGTPPPPPPPPVAGEVTVFAQSAPTLQDTSDTAAVNLGLRFTSSVAGKVLGVRFYKQSGNGGTHQAALWNAAGTRLAQATFAGETASGWQEVRFATPISIAAGVEHTVSYLAPQGRYPYTASATWPMAKAPLSALGGTYAYGSALARPTSSWQGSHYWVDLIFKAD